MNLSMPPLSFSSHKHLVKNFGASTKFEKEIEKGLSDIPKAVFNKISKTGNLEVRVGKKASETFPDYPQIAEYLKNTKVPGTNYYRDDVSSGFYVELDNPKKAVIAIYEKPNKVLKGNKGILGHEFAHRVSAAAEKNTGQRVSDSEDFTKATELDLKKLPLLKQKNEKLFAKYPKVNFDYIVQKDTDGHLTRYSRDEVFAECGAELTTGLSKSKIKKEDKYMQTFFPNTYNYVKKYYQLLGMK